MKELFALLAVFGMACVVWLAYGWLLSPGGCPVRAEVAANGCGDGLEQTVRCLLWLRRMGLWQGEIVIRDAGLNENGLSLARALTRRSGVTLAD